MPISHENKHTSALLQTNSVGTGLPVVFAYLVYFPRGTSRSTWHTFDTYCNGIISPKGGYMTQWKIQNYLGKGRNWCCHVVPNILVYGKLQYQYDQENKTCVLDELIILYTLGKKGCYIGADEKSIWNEGWSHNG